MKKNWKTCSLGDVLEVIGRGTPKTSVSKHWNGEILWLSVANFNTLRNKRASSAVRK